MKSIDFKRKFGSEDHRSLCIGVVFPAARFADKHAFFEYAWMCVSRQAKNPILASCLDNLSYCVSDNPLYGGAIYVLCIHKMGTAIARHQWVFMSYLWGATYVILKRKSDHSHWHDFMLPLFRCSRKMLDDSDAEMKVHTPPYNMHQPR
jgi:hypothetical protein